MPVGRSPPSPTLRWSVPDAPPRQGPLGARGCCPRDVSIRLAGSSSWIEQKLRWRASPCVLVVARKPVEWTTTGRSALEPGDSISGRPGSEAVRPVSDVVAPRTGGNAQLPVQRWRCGGNREMAAGAGYCGSLRRAPTKRFRLRRRTSSAAARRLAARPGTRSLLVLRDPEPSSLDGAGSGCRSRAGGRPPRDRPTRRGTTCLCAGARIPHRRCEDPLLPSRVPSGPGPYQDALRIPGMKPWRDISRNAMRERPNLPM